MKRAFSLLPVGFAIGALVLAGCGSDDDTISIDNDWARTSAAGQTTGAIYFDLTADEADTLMGASVPASIAADAQVHEVVMAESDDMDSGDMDSGDMDSGDMDSGDMDSGDMDSGDMDSGDMGAMVMRELTDGLELTAGETVSFEPGSYHVMLLDLVEPLEVGDEIEVTLEFAEADDVTLTVEVAESAP
jgi:copper(I)-binding protein